MGRPMQRPLLLLLPALVHEARSAARLLMANPFNTCTERSGKVHPQPASSELPSWSGHQDDFFDDYRQWNDIEQFVTQFQSAFPELVTVKTLGSSWEGRSLLAIELTDSSAETAPADKPCIVLMAGIHAREWIAPATALFLAQGVAKSALKEGGSGPASALLQEFVLTIIPVANPDGYHYSWTVNRMWRKTRSTAASCAQSPNTVAGVDANRNWGYMWRVTDDHYYKQDLGNPCTNVYSGPTAFSEPEVLAIATYMEQRQNRSWNLSSRREDGELVVGPGYVAAFIDYHSYAQMLLPPWAYQKGMPEPLDSDYQTGLTHAMVSTIRATSGRSFRTGANLFPNDPGTGPDWAYGRLGVRASMTIELEGPYVSATGFCWPRELIRSVGEEQLAALLTMAEYLVQKGAEPSSLIGTHAKSKWQDLPGAAPPSRSLTTSTPAMRTTSTQAPVSVTVTTAPAASSGAARRCAAAMLTLLLACQLSAGT